MMESQEAGTMTMTTNPFTEAQQAQLRAQIIVFGSILRQGSPFRGLMRLAFADMSQGRTMDDFEEAANLRMSSWNDAWQAALKRCGSKQTDPDEAPSPVAAPAKRAAARKTVPPKASKKKVAARPRRKSQKRTPQKKDVLEDPELETMAASILANDFVEDKTPSVSEEPVEDNDNSESNAEGMPVLQIDEPEFPTGTEVEVLAVEDGLQGVWFSAEVLAVKDNRVHVRYYDLLADHGEDNLEEWVPYHAGQASGPRVRLPHSVTSADVPIKQKPFPVGEHVDVWLNDGWWEAIVVGVDSEKDSVSLYYPGGGDTNSVKLCNLRRSLIWRDGEWVPWTPEARKSEPEQPPPARKSPKVEMRKKKVEAPPVILHGKRKRAKPKRLADGLDDEEADEEEASPSKNRRTARATARKSKRR